MSDMATLSQWADGQVEAQTELARLWTNLIAASAAEQAYYDRITAQDPLDGADIRLWQSVESARAALLDHLLTEHGLTTRQVRAMMEAL